MISDNVRRVETRSILVEVVMVEGIMVEGYVHLTADHRLVDQLNNQAPKSSSVTLTDAKILLPGGVWGQHEFFTINRTQIVCCIPKEAEGKSSRR